MRQTDVIEWLASEAITVLNTVSYLSLETPANHVGLAQDRDEEIYPFVGIQKISTASEDAGIGNGQLYAESASYSNGTIDSVTYGKDSTLRVNVIPTTDGDREVRDKLVEDLEDHFLLFARDERSVPDDMEEPTVEEPTPQGRPEEFVYADGVPIEIEYTRYIENSDVTAAETVTLDIDTEDGATGETTDAHDTSVN